MFRSITLFALSTCILISSCLVLLGQPPAEYYNNTTGLSGEALKTALFDIINDHVVVSESSIWVHFQSTDSKTNGKVWDIYSDVPSGTSPYEYDFFTDQCGTYTQEGDCYNREHSFPKSYFNDSPPMNSDLFHIFPTDGYVNAMRSNYPLGETDSPSFTSLNGSKRGTSTLSGYQGVVFEPIDEYKGDLARSHFYMATRYEDLISNWYNNSSGANAILDGTTYPAFENWVVDMLINWHLSDPVSEKEINRNNAIYAIQGNRNPYVDHPEFVLAVWGTELLPEPISYPTAFSASTIKLDWEEAEGPTLPDGYLIKMSNIGYEHINDPVDGVSVPNSFWAKNVTYGNTSVIFGSLTPNTTYYFKIFSYKGSGSNIDYKTDGSVPQISQLAY